MAEVESQLVQALDEDAAMGVLREGSLTSFSSEVMSPGDSAVVLRAVLDSGRVQLNHEKITTRRGGSEIEGKEQREANGHCGHSDDTIPRIAGFSVVQRVRSVAGLGVEGAHEKSKAEEAHAAAHPKQPATPPGRQPLHLLLQGQHRSFNSHLPRISLLVGRIGRADLLDGLLAHLRGRGQHRVQCHTGTARVRTSYVPRRSQKKACMSRDMGGLTSVISSRHNVLAVRIEAHHPEVITGQTTMVVSPIIPKPTRFCQSKPPGGTNKPALAIVPLYLCTFVPHKIKM